MDPYRYDESMRRDGVRTIAGVDEAGRGPLAGPVVAAAVILQPGLKIEGLRDSKTVPEKERRAIFEEILCSDSFIGLGISEAQTIDRVNILEATRLAMVAAVRDLPKEPDMLIIDAVKLPSLPIRQFSPVKGDSLSASIAASSIVAKVVRDSIMLHYHGLYPEFGFHRHKGYATREHLEVLKNRGPCPIHRRSFSGVKTLALPF
jgi:ribonuclease HII